MPEYAAVQAVVLDFFTSLRIMRVRGDTMKRLGFIHDMLDVKVLILFVMARVNYPVSSNEVYELCYQDDCLSYFDVCTAIPEMVNSGHLKELEDQKYAITDKGRADGSLTEDSIAYCEAACGECGCEVQPADSPFQLCKDAGDSP